MAAVAVVARRNSWPICLVERGLRLRSGGLSYPAIAFVLAEYHGFFVSGSAVCAQLRKHGAAPHPRGRPGNLPNVSDDE